ncbi:filament-like plant protein 1 isoform X2 [Corvus hawaiiensis]|uniref:filament-like plant protein 1 isoform X2 n=1 Tax=Corvus hawaiiensis TaxID=134902 RepID=UPI002018A7CE|nr:filament-like plant protein 1 isoform X2 [Corvus hawaiiensis]
MEQKFLQSERCVCDLKTALDKKEREATASAQKLQDQLLAHVETVKRLEERVQRLEIEKTSLEGTVQQQSDRIEALQRDLQATAPLREMEQKFLQSECCVCDLKTALDKKEREATASAQKLQDQLLAHVETVKRLEERVQRLEIEKTSLEGTVQQQSDRIEALQRDLQATAPVGKGCDD